MRAKLLTTVKATKHVPRAARLAEHRVGGGNTENQPRGEGAHPRTSPPARHVRRLTGQPHTRYAGNNTAH